MVYVDMPKCTYVHFVYVLYFSEHTAHKDMFTVHTTHNGCTRAHTIHTLYTCLHSRQTPMYVRMHT